MTGEGRLAGATMLVLALAGLALAWRQWSGPAEPTLLVTLGLLALAAAMLRWPGVASLGLGAVLLAPAFKFAGVFAAMALAIAVLLCRETIHWSFSGEDEREGEDRWLELAFAVGPVALAVLGSYWALRLFADEGGALRVGLIGAAAYLTLLAALSVGRALVDGRRPTPGGLRPLALDAIGWALGVALAVVLTAVGWGPAATLLAGIGAVALLAVRAQFRARAERAKVARLAELHLAGHRIIFRQADLLSIARQIHAECKRVMRFSWFQLELPRPDGSLRSWKAGPDGVIRSGTPEIPDAPRPLPGIHRRASWKLIQRDLSNAERSFGHLRLWCDPRLLDPSAVEWLDSLMPQMVSSIERTFLDREAREDPLTGLPDRRVLEARLSRAFDLCVEEGRPMAVVMCDLDRFKKINDKHGHAAGDQALLLVAQLLETHRRDGDVCCRFGGEEFALVLDEADGVTALQVAERMRSAVENAIMEVDFKKIPLRVSAGVASHPELHVKQAAELIELADAALYEAKRQGRNRCLLHMGQGRYRQVDGTVIDPENPPPKVEPPTLFA